MASSCVADTSWVYALLDEADAFHGRAVTEAERMEEIHVPVPVLVETLALVKYRTEQLGQPEQQGLARTREAVASLAKRANMRLASPEHDHEATLRVWALHDRLSYPDAAVIAAARREAVDLRTFDRRQRTAHRSGKP